MRGGTLRDADDDGDVGGRLDDLLEGIGGGGEEGFFVEEVFGGVAGDAEFGEGNQVRLRVNGALDVVGD